MPFSSKPTKPEIVVSQSAMPAELIAQSVPLSMNPVLSTQMGTRHRAGIGVTEETDAVAVIVSEETGAISLAVKGNIERDLTVERLRDRLSQLLHRYAPAPTLPLHVEESMMEEEPPSSPPARRHDSSLRPGGDD